MLVTEGIITRGTYAGAASAFSSIASLGGGSGRLRARIMREGFGGVMMMFRVPSVLVVEQEMLMLAASVASDEDDGASAMREALDTRAVSAIVA